MKLVSAVENILRDIEEKEKSQTEALREAEALADKYADIKPRTDMVSPERYMGLPSFSK